MIFDAIRKWLGGAQDGDGEGSGRSNGADGGTGADVISCEEALARIYEFLDGELEGVTHEEVEEHFRVCTRCYPHLRLENKFREALHRAVEKQSAPPQLKSRVLELMEAESASD